LLYESRKYCTSDERFRDVSTRWVFWALSTDIDEHVKRRTSQKDRARGILHQDDETRIIIWVKTWAQVIEDCERRLRFFQNKLNYIPDRDSSLSHLKTTYKKYLADLFAQKDKSSEPAEEANSESAEDHDSTSG
jgi:hypothetical protein